MQITIDQFSTNPAAARAALIDLANDLLVTGWPKHCDTPVRDCNGNPIGYIDASENDISPVLADDDDDDDES